VITAFGTASVLVYSPAAIEGPPNRTDVKCQKFVEDEIVLVVPPSHEWAAMDAVDPAALRTAAVILRERASGTRQVVEDALERARIDARKLRIAMELDSTESIKSAISAGIGVGFVSRWALAREVSLGLLRTIPVRGLRIRRKFPVRLLERAYPGGHRRRVPTLRQSEPRRFRHTVTRLYPKSTDVVFAPHTSTPTRSPACGR